MKLEEFTNLKEALRVLTEQAVSLFSQPSETEFTLESFRYATAQSDLERDSKVTGLPAFEEARAAVGAIPMMHERYSDQWEQFPIQFVYRFIGDLSELTFNLGLFESLWEAFWEELSNADWTWMGLANLTNFHTDTYTALDLGHGTTIRGRIRNALLTLGWSESYLDQLFQEWGGASSAHVLLTTHREPKSPDNFRGNNLEHDLKALNAIRALRLLREGNVGIGRMWISRQVSFDLGNRHEGILSLTGFHSSVSPSAVYALDQSELEALRDLYDTLLQFEGARDSTPVNLNIALQYFSDMYERHSFRDDTRLIDAVTALEALLGPHGELRFRLAFRIAAILGSNHEHREELFKQMREAYDLRSAVVHGSNLSSRQRHKLRDQQPVRDVVRRLLCGFIRLTVTPDSRFNKQFFEGNLDISLVDDTTRSSLRSAMGLEEHSTSS